MVNAEEVLQKIQDFCEGTVSDAQTLVNTFNKYIGNDEEYKKEQAEYLSVQGLKILSENQVSSYYYLMTFLLHATKSKAIYKELIIHCIGDNTISKETRYYLFSQFSGYAFTNPKVSDDETGYLMSNLYYNIYLQYKEELEGELTFVPKENRNKDFVIVTIAQALGKNHAPTRILLDTCYTLEKYLNKKVYIINTAEGSVQYGAISCFHALKGNYIDAYNQIGYLTWKDSSFPLMQCPKNMPDVSIIKEILDVIKSEKPYFMINIGGKSIVADLCSNIVPLLSLGTTSSKMITTIGQFQAIAGEIPAGDKKWMEQHHMPEETIIKCPHSSILSEQSHHYKRQEFNLPQEQFVSVIVSNRLDMEIDAECQTFLDRLVAEDIFVVFVGKFDAYEKYIHNNKNWERNTRCLGYQEDIMAIYELCDLYINPRRTGGGTSAVEALYKGLPVVTCNYGDVGLAVGNDYRVEDYEAMYEQVLRYAKDKVYYENMSNKAKEKAKTLTGDHSEFMRIIGIMEKSERF